MVISLSYKTNRFHKQYLKVTAILVGCFGPVFFLGSMSKSSEAARGTLDFLSWPMDKAQVFLEPTTRFLSASTRGFLLAFGVMICCLSIWVYDKAAELVRRSVMLGLCSWFIIDSTGSVASENTSNALFNIVIFLLAAGPPWFKQKTRSQALKHEK